MKTRIMYIECKDGGLSGPARIGRVRFSKTGRTMVYRGIELLKVANGFKHNCIDPNGVEYWVSGPRKDGGDRLYGENVPIEIDEDAREEYWRDIRNQPEMVGRTTVEAQGRNHGKRRKTLGL